ncbi:MAG: hypothetical protein ACRD1A_08335 [Terriglobales bacterium]
MANAIMAGGLVLPVTAQGPLQSSAEAPGASSWQIQAQLSQGYTNNATVSITQPQADATTSLTLQLNRTWAGPHSNFFIQYTPQGMSFAKNTRLDYISQDYLQSWSLDATPHTKLSWTLNANRFPERGGMPGLGISSVGTVAAASQAMDLGTTLTQANSTFSLSHEYSLRSSWSASFAGRWMDFSPDHALTLEPGQPGPAPASQSRSLDSNFTWSHQVSPDRSLTLGGTDTELWFSNPSQRHRYASAQVGLVQQLGAGMSLQLSGGPSWNWALGQQPNTTALPGNTYAAGATLSEQVGASQLDLSWQHSDQAGLIAGSITTDRLSVQAVRPLGKAWTTSASIGNNRTASLAPGTPARSGLFASGEIAYRMAQWSLQANGTYYNQDVPVSLATLAQLSRLQLSLGVSYSLQGAH